MSFSGNRGLSSCKNSMTRREASFEKPVNVFSSKKRMHSRVKSRYLEHFRDNSNTSSFLTPKKENTKSMIGSALKAEPLLHTDKPERQTIQESTKTKDALESQRLENEAMLDALEEPDMAPCSFAKQQIMIDPSPTKARVNVAIE